jgi:hypothetical protein
MKKPQIILFFLFYLLMLHIDASAQCSICAKTVMQMGNKPAQGFNDGILYLMIVPYIAIGVMAYKWWKNNDVKP